MRATSHTGTGKAARIGDGKDRIFSGTGRTGATSHGGFYQVNLDVKGELKAQTLGAEHHRMAQGDRGGHPSQARRMTEDCDALHCGSYDGCAIRMTYD